MSTVIGGGSLKFVSNRQPAANPLGKSWARLNPAFMARGAPSFSRKGEARVPMPIFKYFTVVGSTLLVFLFISNAYLTDDESNLRFDGSLYESALYAPRVEETRTTAELRFTRDVTPAVRVREVFAVFVPNERRRGKRYS
ncbi:MULTISPECIES: hypothetical protein [unclassified Bradyrhizobium]|uniref:hypothetical protein n=1 Tax=unclassified Bradyrhizobium TaxID=2631580 RepID=UPI002FF1EAD9